MSLSQSEVDHDLFDAVEAMVGEQVKVALDTDDKNVRDARLQPIIDAVHEKFDEQCPRITLLFLTKLCISSRRR